MLLGLNACSERQQALTAAQVRQIETQIQQSFDALVAASEALDTDRYFALIDADKFVGLNADGSNWNSFADLKALIEPGFNAVAKIESLTFSNVRISVIDANTAILVNQYQQTVLLKDGTTHSGAGGGTQVWSKASGEWLLVSISASGQ